MAKETKKESAGRKQAGSSPARSRIASTEAPRRGSAVAAPGKLRIQYVRSAIGFTKRQKETVRGLGLTRLNQIVERPDTPQVRGMVNKIPHLVTVLES
jgi:large subunit ribosomal protein L30